MTTTTTDEGLQRRLSRKAADLVDEHLELIARKIVRQVRATVPRYGEIDALALEKQSQQMLRALAGVVRQGDAEAMVPLVRSLATMRAASGMGAEDFMLAALCYLQVLRRFYFSAVKDAARAMLLYESVEVLALPIIARIVSIFGSLGQEQTAPDGLDVRHFLSILTQSSQEGSPIEAVDLPSFEEEGFDTLDEPPTFWEL